MGQVIVYKRQQASRSPMPAPTIKFSHLGASLNATAARMLTRDGVTHVRMSFDVDSRELTLEPVEPGPDDSIMVMWGSSVANISARGFAEECNLPRRDPHELVEVGGVYVAQF